MSVGRPVEKKRKSMGGFVNWLVGGSRERQRARMQQGRPVAIDPADNLNRVRPRAGVGIAVGCFVGAGYGIVVGLGRPYCIRRDQCVVVPAATPFAQEGLLMGCYCGVALGVGFGPSLARGIGFAAELGDLWQVRLQDLNVSARMGEWPRTAWEGVRDTWARMPLRRMAEQLCRQEWPWRDTRFYVSGHQNERASRSPGSSSALHRGR